MSKVDIRVQYEAGMMSMSLMMIGLILSIIYAIFYFDFPIWYDIVLIINGLAGFVFISSYLITTFQAYNSYMEIQEFQKDD